MHATNRIVDIVMSCLGGGVGAALVHGSRRCPRKLPMQGLPDPHRAMTRTKSKIHTKYKTKYRVGNWAAYDRSLVERGNLTIWLSPAAIARWKAKPSRRRGGPPKCKQTRTLGLGSLHAPTPVRTARCFTYALRK